MNMQIVGKGNEIAYYFAFQLPLPNNCARSKDSSFYPSFIFLSEMPFCKFSPPLCKSLRFHFKCAIPSFQPRLRRSLKVTLLIHVPDRQRNTHETAHLFQTRNWGENSGSHKAASLLHIFFCPSHARSRPTTAADRTKAAAAAAAPLPSAAKRGACG